MGKTKKAVLYAILAAVCYGVSSPLAKLLLEDLSPVFMAALLYLGAGLGMLLLRLLPGFSTEHRREAVLRKKELPYVIEMVVLDIAAPILLMAGLTLSNPATVSLINNFEIVATTIIALVIFKEAVGRRLWIAVVFITVSSMLLSVQDAASLSFSSGALLALLACVCWGLENNCTRMLSLKDPLQIVVIKGIGSGTGSLLIALFARSVSIDLPAIFGALLLGFFAYGLSIYFYILAQRELGAVRTSAYYAAAPFVGVGLSFLLFYQPPAPTFWVALALMLLGAYYAAFENHSHRHVHQAMIHEHRHSHSDGHHIHGHLTHGHLTHGHFAHQHLAHQHLTHGHFTHQHFTHEQDILVGDEQIEHSHPHVHEELIHTHPHTPDLHHTHTHS